MQFATTVQLLISGLALGAVYVLVATGFYITHLTVNKVNFGQGDFVMAAAFLLLSTRTAGWPLALGIPAVVAALAAIGWVLERVAIKPLERRRASPIGAYAWILTTAGVAFIIQNLAELIYGKSAQYSPPLFSQNRDAVIPVLGINLPGLQLGSSRPIFGDFLRLTYIENPGMAFGIDIGGKLFFSIFSIIASIGILIYLYTARNENLAFRIALALILGGAVGNLIDRVFYGAIFNEGPLFYGRVVDFIDADFFNINFGLVTFE